MTHVKETRHARLYTGRRQEALKSAGCRCEKLVMGILVADRDGETVKDLCQQDLRLPVGGPRTGPERKAIVWKHRANQSSSRQITSVTTEVLPGSQILFYFSFFERADPVTRAHSVPRVSMLFHLFSRASPSRRMEGD